MYPDTNTKGNYWDYVWKDEMKKMDRQRNIDTLLDFIYDTKCEYLENNVVEQAKKCFLDLAGVMCAGAKNNSAKKAAAYVVENFPKGECTIMATGQKSNLIGAALANGMSANALDMDDGYSLLRGHPGAGFFGALITAAEASHCTYGEFLGGMIVSYEVSIRQGYLIRDFYKWDHSSGCYSAFGTATGVGKLLKLSREELEMALGISDFIAPLTPAKRSCYIPSMNKDGIYYGQHAGTQAVMLAKSGITGKNPVIFDEEYHTHFDTLGKKFYMFDLYVKFYSCCRWAHSPIRAVKSLMDSNCITAVDIEKVDVYSFGNAGTLYKCAPKNEDEAQYNIKYPIAAQIVFGDCGPLESSTTKMLDKRISPMIEKINFHHEPEYDKVFPAQRLSRVEITLKNGKIMVSDAFEPQGDRNEEVSIDDIKSKISKINMLYAEKEYVDALIEAVLTTPLDAPFDNILAIIRKLAKRNIYPEIEFI